MSHPLPPLCLVDAASPKPLAPAYGFDGYPRPNRHFMERWRARCVEGYVAVHLHAKIRMGDLAKVTRSSQSKFHRSFKASFGCTPGQYVRRMRIARAQNLMIMSSEPLCQIAAECGFADQAHFSRCFRKFVGNPPALWRARQHV
jgi:AraC family transcriptional regulator